MEVRKDKPKYKRKRLCSMEDYITKLLEIKGVKVTNLKEIENRIEIEIETEPKPARCPCCSQETKYIHDYRTQRIKHVGYMQKEILLLLKKRRYICKSCNKRFFEKYDFLPRYHRMTRKVYELILHELRENVSMKSIAARYNVSQATVPRIFDIVNYQLYKLPKIIAIDEFKGNAGNEKYQAILTNPEKHKLLDILPTREKTHLIDYFKNFKNRNSVEFVVMDMWEPYRDICFLFPNAAILVDRYHYVRQVYWALDRVRKRIQKNFYQEKRVYFKHSRCLLFADFDKLSYDNKQAVRVMLSQHYDLFVAWQLKELFKNFENVKILMPARRF